MTHEKPSTRKLKLKPRSYAGLKSSRVLLFVLATSAASFGCSPYVYGPEISKFAGGVDALHDADRASKANLAKERRDTDFRMWTARTEPNLTTQNCELRKRGCQIWNAAPGENERKWRDARAAVDSVEGLSRSSLKVLQSYVQGLKAITDAKDSADLEGAQKRFNGALTGVIGKQGGDAHTAEFGAITNVFAWLTKTALEYSRLQSLKDATEAGHAPVVELAGALGQEVNRLRDARITELRLRSSFLSKRLRTASIRKTYGEILAALERATILIAGLQRQNGEALGMALINAHKALRDALQDDSRQVESVFSAVEEFTDLANQIYTAFKS